MSQDRIPRTTPAAKLANTARFGQLIHHADDGVASRAAEPHQLADAATLGRLALDDQRDVVPAVVVVPDVVVVPIVWKEKKDECEQITGACKSLHRALKKAGLQCALDDNNDFMPGTKFKFWEQRGVKLRVELGPRDYRQHLITIATTTVPGRVADKQTIKHITEQQVADHVKRMLTSLKESIESEQNKKHVKFD